MASTKQVKQNELQLAWLNRELAKQGRLSRVGHRYM
jgi:hypothetical protein